MLVVGHAAQRREAEAQINLRPRAPRAEFARPQGNRFRVRELEGVEFTRLYSSHESEPRERGDGYIYFFTGGSAEPAVVHLHGGNDETFSVMLHGASGRPEIFDHAIELPRVGLKRASSSRVGPNTLCAAFKMASSTVFTRRAFSMPLSRATRTMS